MKTDPNCIFCKIARGEIPCQKIYEDDLSLAFLDLSPINTGHTLLIPKNHEDQLWDLDDETYHYLFNVSKKIKSSLQKTYSPPRVGLVVEGFGVAHVHIHLIPIYSGDDISKPHIPASPKELEQEAEKIKTNL